MSAPKDDDGYQRNCAKVHIAVGQLGMDEDTYHALLQRVAGVDSFAKLFSKPGKQRDVLAELQRLGWRPKERAPTRPGRRMSRPTQGEPTPLDKLRALWIQIGQEGGVEDASEAALDAWVRRMTHGRIDAAAWLANSPGEARHLIEAAKRWLHRFEKTANDQAKSKVDQQP